MDREPRFLFAILSSQSIIDELQVRAESRSGTFPQITYGAELAPIKVMIPDKGTQKKIVSFLDCIQGKMDINEAINRNLSEQLDALYMNRFADGVTGKLSDICTYGKDHIDVEQLTEETYYSTENMLPNKMGSTIASGLPKTVKIPECHKGDVLISNIRPYFKKIVYCYGNAGCSADVLCFVPNQEKLSTYLYATLYTNKFFDYMVAGSKGTKMPRGDKQQIMQYPIHIPTDEELREFTAVAMNILDMIHKNSTENDILVALRDSLLPKLMSGELDVSDIDI